jgi:hypothetical protein
VDKERVDLKTAAGRLDSTVDALRKRIKRGSLQGELVDGRWYAWIDKVDDGPAQPDMWLDDEEDTAGPSAKEAGQPEDESNGQNGILIVALQSHIEDLQRTIDEQIEELQARRHEAQQANEERAELRRLMGNMQMQLAQLLPPPREETTVAVNEDQSTSSQVNSQPGPAPIGEQETTVLSDVQPPRRPWWKVWG